MTLQTCAACWRFECRCPDGRGWMHLEATELLAIRESISRALDRQVEECNCTDQMDNLNCPVHSRG